MSGLALKTAIAIAAMAMSFAARADLRVWPETGAMLAQPDQPGPVYAFVNRAIDEDRLSEAANALERLVRFRPDLVQARFDLIALYDALGAGDLAEEQREALAEAGAFEDVGGDIDVSGFIAIGAGYDSNPAAIPRDDVLSFLSPITGQVEDVVLGLEREDSALAFLQASARIAAPIDASASFIVDLSAYGAHFFDDSDQDDATVAVRAGPEMTFAQGAIRPFLDVGYRHFGGDPYAVAAALGVEATARLGPGVLGFEMSGGYRDYIPTRDTPGRENLDGSEGQVTLSYGAPLGAGLLLDLSATAAAVNADKDFEDYYAFGADAALSIDLGPTGRPVIATLGGGVLHSRYKRPDFQILDVKRRDTSVAAYFALSTDLDAATSIDGTISYRRRFSNYDVYDNDGYRFTLRLARRF